MSSKSTTSANRKTTVATSTTSKSTSKPATTKTGTSTSGSTVVSLNSSTTPSPTATFDAMVASWDEVTTNYVEGLQLTLDDTRTELEHVTKELNYARGMVKYLAKDLDVK